MSRVNVLTSGSLKRIESKLLAKSETYGSKNNLGVWKDLGQKGKGAREEIVQCFLNWSSSWLYLLLICLDLCWFSESIEIGVKLGKQRSYSDSYR